MDHFALFYLNQYVSRHSELDLVKRDCDSHKECYVKYTSSLRRPTSAENATLRGLCARADEICSNKRYNRLTAIPWKIMFFGSGEFPFPHTHGDTICLPYNFLSTDSRTNKIVETLIHEKIHIFQRLYPLQTHILLLNVWNYQIRSRRALKKRNNPDTNDYAYADENGKDIVSEYADLSMRSSKIIGDDHPYEIMAYKLTDNILSSKDLKSNGKEKEEEEEE